MTSLKPPKIKFIQLVGIQIQSFTWWKAELLTWVFEQNNRYSFSYWFISFFQRLPATLHNNTYRWYFIVGWVEYISVLRRIVPQIVLDCSSITKFFARLTLFSVVNENCWGESTFDLQLDSVLTQYFILIKENSRYFNELKDAIPCLIRMSIIDLTIVVRFGWKVRAFLSVAVDHILTIARVKRFPANHPN